MHVLIYAWCCTKGVANLRRDHDGVGVGGRAAGRVAGRVVREALPARAPRHLRRRPAPLRARHDTRLARYRMLFLRPLRPHVHWRSRFESQLGNSGRYVAGKRRNTGFLPVQLALNWFGFKASCGRKRYLFYFVPPVATHVLLILAKSLFNVWCSWELSSVSFVLFFYSLVSVVYCWYSVHELLILFGMFRSYYYIPMLCKACLELDSVTH